MAFRSATTASAVSGSTSISITKPTGCADDDIVIVAIIMRSASAGDTTTAPTDPSVWSVVGDTRDTGKAVRCKVFKKVASSEGASWSFALSGATPYAAAVCACYSGRDTATPVNVQNAAPVWTSQAGGVTTYTAASITPTVNGCDVIGVFGVDDTGDHRPLTSSDGSTTPRGTGYESATFVMTMLEDFNQATAAAFAPGATYASAPAQGSWKFAFALAPASAGKAYSGTPGPSGFEFCSNGLTGTYSVAGESRGGMLLLGVG